MFPSLVYIYIPFSHRIGSRSSDFDDHMDMAECITGINPGASKTLKMVPPTPDQSPASSPLAVSSSMELSTPPCSPPK